MEAILSGPAGLGLVMEGEKAWLIRWDQPGELLETTLAYATRLFRGREGDLRRFTVNQPQEAFPHMDRLRRQAEALDLLFSALEVTLDEGFRRDVSQDLEQRLEEASVWHYLAGMLYSQPVPDLHACGVAIWSAEQVDALRLADFLKGVVSSQAEIQQARRAWDRIGDEIFSPATRPFYLQTLVESGLFYEFVLALRSGQTSDFQFRAVQALQALPNHRPIIQAWATPLSGRSPGSGDHS